MATVPSLTDTQVLAQATSILTDGGYTLVTAPSSWTGTVRLFEDSYGIVALHLFDTWSQLVDSWPDAQGLLVDLISEHLTRPDPKASEGYLVLITAAPITQIELAEQAGIQYNTNRVRKLVITGGDLERLDDIRLALLPLLPLEIDETAANQAGLLEQLPDLLADDDVTPEDVNVIVEAFIRNESIIERLHQYRGIS